MKALLQELLQCNHSGLKLRPGAARCLSVNAPTELWAELQSAADGAVELTESRLSLPTHKQRARAAQTLQAALIPDALLRINVVEHLTGLGESTIRRKMAAADFPRPIKNGALHALARRRRGDLAPRTRDCTMSSPFLEMALPVRRLLLLVATRERRTGDLGSPAVRRFKN